MKKILSICLCLFMGISLYAQPASGEKKPSAAERFPAMGIDVEALPGYTVYYPQALQEAVAKNGALPVFIFGNGGCSHNSEFYLPTFAELVDNGYMVIAIGTPDGKEAAALTADTDLMQLGRGDNLLDAINWVCKANAKAGGKYYHTANCSRIAVGGHSCGGAQAMAVSYDPRVKTTLMLNSGMGEMRMAGAAKADLAELHSPILYLIGGPEDVAYPNAAIDFKGINHVPVVSANFPVGHGGTYGSPKGGVLGGIILQWLDWQLKNDEDASRFFTDEDWRQSNYPQCVYESKGIIIKRARRSGRYNNAVTSPRIGENGEVSFSLQAPKAKKVELEGQFMSGRKPMTMNDEGVWSTTVSVNKPDIYPYSFYVDGVQTADPANIQLFPNERFKASLLEMPDADALYTVQDVPHGRVSYCTYYSDVLGMYRPVLVYTPAEYGKGKKKYPVFYLVSGTTDTEETWFKVGRVNTILDNLIARGKAEPMIVVMPYGYMNNGTPGPSTPEAAEMYGVFAKELTECVMPFVEKNYRTKNGAENRAIAGFSRGGGQSLFTALSHTDKFAWLASYSAYLTPEVLEKYFNPFMQDPSLLQQKLKLFWFGVGNSDFLFRDVQRNLKFFDEKQVKYTYMETEGGHTWMNARTYLAETLQKFFKK